MAYRLALPPSLARMHEVFHISVLRHYISDPSHVIDFGHLQVPDEGTIMAEPVRILDQQTLHLRRQLVDQVKVQWDNYSPSSSTWEDTEEMHHRFPYLF